MLHQLQKHVLWKRLPSLSWVGATADGTNVQLYTFTSHATGTPRQSRKTIVGVSGRDGTADFSILTVTLGGVTMTEVVDAADVGSLANAGIYILDNPLGTTSTITVNFSEAVSGCAIGVWAAYDLLSSTAYATASQFQTISAELVLDLACPANGIVISQSNTNLDGGNTTTWNPGMMERVDAVLAADMSYSSADGICPNYTRSYPVRCDWTGADDAIGVAASFR